MGKSPDTRTNIPTESWALLLTQEDICTYSVASELYLQLRGTLAISEYILHLPHNIRQYYTSIGLRVFKLIVLLCCQRNGFKPRQSQFSILCQVQVTLIFHKPLHKKALYRPGKKKKKKSVIPLSLLLSLIFENRRRTIIFLYPCNNTYQLQCTTYCNIYIIDSSLRNMI